MNRCFVAALLLCAPIKLMYAADVQMIEDFEGFIVKEVPSKGWETRGGSARGSYLIAQENKNHYLSAQDKGRSVQLFRKGGWNIKKKPYLQWKWRVREFPKGADERDPAKNDSAVGLYVVFPKRWFVPETIKYVWSTTAPKDTVITRRNRFPIIVVRSGEIEKGKWVVESRNVYQDFQDLFGRKPSNPVAIGFLTDANSVGGVAEGDYDDIQVRSALSGSRAVR